MGVKPARRKFTVEEYACMGAAGILREDERVELIEGEIIEMPPISSGHSGGVGGLAELFYERLRRRAIVWVQNPILLSEHSEPQPDIAILRRRESFYRDRHPEPTDVLLVIEVSHSSLAYDRDVKIPLYAAAGIPEAWLARVRMQRLYIYRNPDPAGGLYRDVHTVGPGETVSPLAFPDIVLTHTDIFG